MFRCNGKSFFDRTAFGETKKLDPQTLREFNVFSLLSGHRRIEGVFYHGFVLRVGVDKKKREKNFFFVSLRHFLFSTTKETKKKVFYDERNTKKKASFFVIGVAIFPQIRHELRVPQLVGPVGVAPHTMVFLFECNNLQFFSFSCGETQTRDASDNDHSQRPRMSRTYGNV